MEKTSANSVGFTSDYAKIFIEERTLKQPNFFSLLLLII
jgi:hypothetical protein